MKKQLRKAMICTVAMMLVAVLTLTGVTYAWFSESNEATVDGITMDVVSKDGGVYISKDPYPANFDISVAIEPETDIFTGKHNPSSTAGTLSGGKLTFYNGTIGSPTDKTLDIEAVSEEGYYFEQDIYFDNSTGGKDITVSLAGTEIAPEGGKRTDLAVRIAVVTHGSISIEDFKNQNDYPVASSIDAVQIYEPKSTEHIPAGVTEYQKNIKPEAGQSDAFKYYGLNGTGTDINRFGETAATQLVDMTTLKHTDGTAVLKRSAGDVKITVPQGQYLKTTIYVWLEGQDADCQNNISGKPYTAAIKFTLE